MSTTELAKYVGLTGYYAVEGKGEFSPRVKIVDAKAQFGRVDVLIEPTDGKGKRWVSLQNVTLDESV